MISFFLSQLSGIYLGRSCGFLKMCSGLCCIWTEVAACWIWWFIARQLIISSSWFERCQDYVANSWKDQAALQGGVVVSGWLKGRPSDVVASVYVSSEIPLNSDEGTLTKSIIHSLSCFNREELN